MSDELDNDLKRRISQVFDNYENDGADAGWMQLREKFPAPAKHRGIARLWWASAAAVLLLFLSVGLWLTLKDGGEQTQLAQNTGKSSVKQQAQQPTEAPAVADKTEVEPVADPSKTIAENYERTQFATPAPSLSNRPYTPDVKSSKKATPVIEDYSTQDNIIDDDAAPALATTNKVEDKPAIVTVNKPATVVDVQPVITEKAATQPVLAQQAPVEPKNSLMAMLEKDSRKNNEGNKRSASDKAVNLGVYAATYVNYAKGSDNRVNVGAGLSSDFRITKNLKLSTGIAIAQNSFNYNSGRVDEVPQAAVQQSVAVASMVSDEKMFGGFIAPPTLQNYNASLVGLDIPVNLKYEFSPDKNDTYISAGLSSGTFLNESYNYRYGYTGNSSMQTIDEKISESFGNFYFARTLNVSFGIGYPLGKSNRLVIEPFVKYPLDGMGAQQIKFGSGGVNLKLNFQTRKK
ncbi:MAG: hypothetical protein EOP46_07390 [Sphingobacteriaceae bacterium]|nr:MAG: hypothetical protein EOP46_07390 [Sphingobacteriaceae bacterium]